MTDAASGFDFAITARDKYTAMFEDAKKKASGFTDHLKGATERLHRFGEDIGVEKGLDHLERVGNAVDKVTEKLGGIERPLSFITGVGSLAEMAELTIGWAESGEKIGIAARNIGIGGEEIQGFSRSAEMLGVSSDKAVGGLQALGDTMEGAEFGRNPEALMMMNKLGLQLHRTKDGAVDSADGMLQLADAVSKLNGNPQVQRQIANAFGVGDLLPVLQKGRKGLEELQDEVKRTGAVMSEEDIGKAEGFVQSVRGLGNTFVGIKNAMAANSSGLTPYISNLSHAIVEHKGFLASSLEVAGGLAAIRSAAWGIPFAAKLARGFAVNPAIGLLGGIPRALVMRGGMAAAGAAEGFGMEAIGGALLGVAAAAEATSAALIAAGVGAAALLGRMAFYGVEHWSALNKDTLAGPDGSSATSHMNWLLRQGYNIGKFLYNGGDALRQGFGLPGNGMANVMPEGMGGTRGDRNHNPWNLRGWNPNGPHDAGGFDQFGTDDAGIMAASGQLFADSREGQDTLAAIISKASPASDGNDTAGMIRRAAAETGYGASQRLDLTDPSVQQKLLPALFHQEGTGAGLSAQQILQDILEELKKQTGQGTQTIHSPTPNLMPVSLAHSAMPGNLGDSTPKFGP